MDNLALTATVGRMQARDASASDSTTVISNAEQNDEALEAARAFEQILVRNLLKSMRTAARGSESGDAASNARGMYEERMDEAMAGFISDSGGLGLANHIARSLDPEAAPPTTGMAELPARPAVERVTGLSAADLVRLKELVKESDIAEVRRPTGAVLASRNDAFTSHSLSQDEFIDPLVAHAARAAERLGTSADAVLAVAALETGWGRFPLRDANGADSHNLFGIKQSSSAIGTLEHATTEYVNGQPQSQRESFARFSSPAHAVDAFADFVLENPRYAPALEQASDPEAFLRGLHEAGYATDPAYGDKAVSTLHKVQSLREAQR